MFFPLGNELYWPKTQTAEARKLLVLAYDQNIFAFYVKVPASIASRHFHNGWSFVLEVALVTVQYSVNVRDIFTSTHAHTSRTGN